MEDDNPQPYMGGSQNPVKQRFTKTKGYVVREDSGGGRDQSNLCMRLYIRGCSRVLVEVGH